jgi:hypothetical protein
MESGTCCAQPVAVAASTKKTTKETMVKFIQYLDKADADMLDDDFGCLGKIRYKKQLRSRQICLHPQSFKQILGISPPLSWYF